MVVVSQTDRTLTKGILALPHRVLICDALKQFKGTHSATPEQHNDLRPGPGPTEIISVCRVHTTK